MSSIGAAEIGEWLDRLGGLLEAAQDVLDELDSGAGDGDHGASMVMGFRRVLAGSYPADSSPAQVLRTASRLFAGVGGSIGPLWGMALLRAAQAVDGAPVLTGELVAAALAAAAAGAAEIGSASVGDRTLLDALVPSADRYALTLAETRDFPAAARAGTAAALAGARSTADLKAARGRAARNPALAAGRVDAGAASVALAWIAAVDPGGGERWRAAVCPGNPA
jgi:dihydroxyacetone kinase-like protein